MAPSQHRSLRDRSTRFVTDYEDQATTEDDVLEIPEDLSTLDDAALAALSTQANEAFAALYQGGQATLNEADLETLGALADGIEALAAATAERETAEQGRRDAAAALAARVNPEAEVEDETAEVDAEDETAEVDAEADAETEEVVEEDEALVAGSGRRGVRVNMADVRSRQGQRRQPAAETPSAPTIRDFAMAAPDVPGFSNGQGMDFSDMGRAVNSRLTSFNKASYAAAARAKKHMRQQFGVATIRKPFADDLMITSEDPGHIEQVFARAADEARLEGGSLVASGGWCAPSETVYDLFRDLESRDGLFSVPEVGISRGGVSWTVGPDFADLFSHEGFFDYTEEEDEAGDYDGAGGGSKPCFKVECPPFDDERLRLAGLCISAGLLQQRGYPETIARTVRGSLVAHAHRMAANKINAIVAGSTAISMPSPQVGAAAPILTAIELQVEHYRDVRRMSRSASLEAVFPFWVRGAIRSDLSRRLGIDLIDVPDARIDGWFRARGVNPQFVYNWQSVGTTAASGFTSWPTEVDFLLYAAGTWVAGGADVITLDTIYDSVLLGTNDYTALFTEEGWLMTKRGHDSRLVTVPISSDGETGAGVLIDHDGTPGA